MKLSNKIHTGRTLPKHIGKAWGRHVFRLTHGGRDCGLWLRDLPLNLADLASEYGLREPLKAYFEECDRANQSPLYSLADYRHLTA